MARRASSQADEVSGAADRRRLGVRQRCLIAGEATLDVVRLIGRGGTAAGLIIGVRQPSTGLDARARAL